MQMPMLNVPQRQKDRFTGSSGSPRRERGSTLLEMMMAVAILSVVAGVVFSQITDLFKKNSGEQGKVDITQQTREFMDEIIRDMHQCGYPSVSMYDPPPSGPALNNCTPGSYCQDVRVAAGVTSFSPTDLVMEGDFDGDGTINIVEYALYDASGNKITSGSATCPCSIRRTEYQKPAIPGSVTPTYYMEVQNVINADAAGTVTVSGTTAQGVSNTTAYSAYTASSIFQAFDPNGCPVPGDADTCTPTTPTWPITDTLTLSTIHTVKVTMNILSQYKDLNSGTNSVISMSAAARVHNNF
jgi:prepilin-type N-terminal cleavage/methylation domain-containing protein